jgi:hypothetical protein
VTLPWEWAFGMFIPVFYYVPEKKEERRIRRVGSRENGNCKGLRVLSNGIFFEK